MKLDHSELVLDLEGKPIPQWDTNELGQPKTDGKGGLVSKGDLTMRDAAIAALSSQDPKETIGAELKARIFSLSIKFYKGRKINLTIEEAALLKERAGGTLSMLVYGRLCEWLEGETPALPTDAEED